MKWEENSLDDKGTNMKMHSQQAHLCAWCCCLTPQSAASLMPPAKQLNKLSAPCCLWAVMPLLPKNECADELWESGCHLKMPSTYLVLLSGTSIMTLPGYSLHGIIQHDLNFNQQHRQHVTLQSWKRSDKLAWITFINSDT